MRVALVVAGPYPALRGSQVLVGHLALGLRERGHEVSLVTYGARRGRRPGLRPGRVVLDAILVARLWRHVRRRAIDVIHAHNYEAAIAGLIVGRLTGTPVVYHGHSAMAEELPTYVSGRRTRRLLGRLGHLLDTQVPRRADYCIAVTPELGEHLRRGGVAQRALACIEPTSVPAEVRKTVPVPRPESGRGLVCYAGNLDGYQNLAFLLETFRAIRAAEPRARLLLLTHHDARAEARRLREGDLLGPGVEIEQARSYDEVRSLLAGADVAVLPRAERSGFPMKLLNYMAAGKAIVACAGSAKGLADGVSGRVVPDGDSAAFAAVVVELLRDPAGRARLGTAARHAVEGPEAWEHVLDRIESIYRTVVAGAGPALVPVTATE
ncbi:MAG: glycosyltransferase family 4 protein [bacterium]|nr:glycosyltransferase family 4 protein [bacterium]